jgi:small neutral amino acid transporter SnatA (MarC family)
MATAGALAVSFVFLGKAIFRFLGIEIYDFMIAGTLLSTSGALMRLMGESGAKALSKVTSLLLAAIAVMLVRKGLLELVRAARL